MTTATLEDLISSPSISMPEIQELALDDAMELANSLTKSTRTDTDGTTVFRGLDTNGDPLVVIIPPFGNPLVVPVAIRYFV